MKTHTQKYKDQLKTLGRELDLIITYTESGINKTLTNEDINSVNLVYNGNILKSVMKQLDVVTKYLIPINTTLHYQLGIKTRSGKNKFDKANTNWYRNSNTNFNNTTNTSSTYIRTTAFEIAGGNSYVVSGIPSGITLYRIRTYNSDKTYLSSVTPTSNKFTLNSNVAYIYLLFNGTGFDNTTNTTMKNANIQVELGTTPTEYEDFGMYEYMDYGDFIVYSCEKQEDTDDYKITCYDKMLYSMKDYETLGISYPITIRDYIIALCTKIGLTFANSSDNFPNYNRIINQELYLDSDNNSLGYTYRDVLDELAQVTASTICIKDNGQLELRYITDALVDGEVDVIDAEFMNDEKVEFKEKYGPINSIVLSRSSDSDNVYLQDTGSISIYGLHELKIRNNQIMNFDDRADYLPDILAVLDGLKYYINDFNSKGITYLELCDRYYIEVNDRLYDCVMFNDELEVNQGLKELIYTEIPEETKTDYNTASKDDRTRTKAEIIVDKHEGEIRTLTSKVVDLTDTKTATGTITLENAHEGQLHYLSIKGNITPLVPSNTLYPSIAVRPKGSNLLIDTDVYYLDFDILRYIDNDICDEFIYEDGNCYIIRRVDSNGNPLAEEVIEERNPIILNVKSNSTIKLGSYNNAILKCNYLLENVYTDNFASQIQVKSELIQTAGSIEAKVSSVADENGNVTSGSILLAINKDESEATINADKISLEGKNINLTSEDITIESTNFKVDKDGKVEANQLTTGNNLYIGSQEDYGIKRIQFTDNMYISRYVSSLLEIMQLISPKAVNIKVKNSLLSILDEQIGLSLDDGSSYVATFRDDGITFAFEPVISSDKRLKDNIKDLDVSFIDDLNIKEYEYKKDKKKHIGLIAQDYVDKDYSKYFLNKDKNDYYGIRYNDITNALIKYCQELKKRIDKQDEEIELLKKLLLNHYDVNKDGKVNSKDLLDLRKYLLKGDGK